MRTFVEPRVIQLKRRKMVERESRDVSGAREAIDADLDRLLQMAKMLHFESRYRVYAVEDEKMRRLFSQCIRVDAPWAVCFVYERQGRIIGFIAGYASELFFSRSIVAQDLMYYVLPENRGSGAALALWRAFQAWAQSLGACEIMMSTTTLIAPENTSSFLSKIGLHEIGRYYVKYLRLGD